jgi:hypothetical protein
MLALFCLAGGCNTRKTTSPVEPTIYLMKDYFPLNDGDEWIWDMAVLKDSVTEPFVDGDINLGEPFTDIFPNGVHDPGEPFIDYNRNGIYDGPDDLWTTGVPYEDRNSDGEYDPPNGRWDEGEYFTDLDGNGICNSIQHLHIGVVEAAVSETTSLSADGSVVITRRLRSLGPGPVLPDQYTDDGFSNDSLGLRWHLHNDRWLSFQNDNLKNHGPLIIAEAETGVGDRLVNADTCYAQDGISEIHTWISIFEAVEDVTVRAGTFQECLKFKTIASGWKGNMKQYNGTSYQWYAIHVGLVKSEGPDMLEFWRLQNAETDGAGYP